MSHLEDLVVEYYDWLGYLIKRNIKVGRLSHGGWEMELDVIAYHPQTDHLIHLEPSLDADSWGRREIRFEKKFSAGRKYILQDIFPWLSEKTEIDQVAILISHPQNRDELSGGRLISVDEFIAAIKEDITKLGVVSSNAISEQYPLLELYNLL